MENHPLQYFKNLITKHSIEDERIKFLFSSDYGTVTQRDVLNDIIEYAVTNALIEDSPAEVKTMSFTLHLESIITDEIFNSIDNIDLTLLTLDDEKKQVLYLKTLYKSLNSLILYAEKLDYINKYSFIASLLRGMRKELIDKYNVKDDTTAQTQINLQTHSQSSSKLQWMGKSKVLITLFYDLYSNVENGGEPLIKATKDQIKNFLLNNFIEKDGQSLSPSSIDTLLTPSKEDKRALKGDRIELNKYKGKS